jgi:Zn-dependent protease
MTFKKMDVSLHWTFLLLLLWVILANFMSGFEQDQLGWSFLLVLSGMACLMLHEAAHYAVARFLGLQPNSIILVPMGEISDKDLQSRKWRNEILISLAGPAVNLLIAALLLFFIHPYRAFWEDPENLGAPSRGTLLFQLHVINLAMAALNLLPAFPLDGGRILRSLLAIRLNFIKATHIAALVGKLIACFLIILGFFSYNIFLTLTGIFIFFVEKPESYYLKLESKELA